MALFIKRKKPKQIMNSATYHIILLLIIVSNSVSVNAQDAPSNRYEKKWEQLRNDHDYLKDPNYQGPQNEYFTPPHLRKNPTTSGKSESTTFSKTDDNQIIQRRNSKQGSSSGGADPPRKRIKKIREDEPQTKRSREEIRYEEPPDTNTPSGSSAVFVKWLLYLIGITVVCILIYQLIIKNGFKKGEKLSKPIQEDGETLNPHEKPLDALEEELARHLKNNDFRAAVRVQYLITLKNLVEKELIKWQNEKTNYHYQRELSGNKVHADFRYVISVFERVWYGLYYINSEEYQQVANRFEKLHRQLST